MRIPASKAKIMGERLESFRELFLRRFKVLFFWKAKREKKPDKDCCQCRNMVWLRFVDLTERFCAAGPFFFFVEGFVWRSYDPLVEEFFPAEVLEDFFSEEAACLEFFVEAELWGLDTGAFFLTAICALKGACQAPCLIRMLFKGREKVVKQLGNVRSGELLQTGAG